MKRTTGSERSAAFMSILGLGGDHILLSLQYQKTQAAWQMADKFLMDDAAGAMVLDPSHKQPGCTRPRFFTLAGTVVLPAWFPTTSDAAAARRQIVFFAALTMQNKVKYDFDLLPVVSRKPASGANE